MIDLSNFKLLKEDDKSYEVGHPNGKKLVVDKQGLSDKAHKAIQKLKGKEQKFDDGGEVQDEGIIPSLLRSASNYVMPQAQAQEQPTDNQQFNMEAEANIGQAPTAPITPVPGVGATDATAGTTNPNDPFAQMREAQNSGLDAQKQALDTGFNAVQNANNQKNAAMNEAMNGVNGNDGILALQQQLKQQTDALNNKDDAAAVALSKMTAVDHNRLLKNMDTGPRIAAGIGLLLSGIGSGLTHTPNMAMQVINDAINRDVEDQRSSNDNAMTLWKINREKLGSDVQANLMTQNQLMNIAKVKTDMAMNSANTAQAQQQLMMMKANIDQTQKMNNAKLAIMQNDNIDPAYKVPYLIQDPGQQKEALATIDHIKDLATKKANALAAFDSMASKIQGNPKGWSIDQLMNTGEYGAMLNEAQNLNKDVTGRVNEFATGNLMKSAPGFSAEENAKRRQNWSDQFDQQINKGASQLKTVGIDPTRYYKNQVQQQMAKPGATFNVPGKGLMQVSPDGKSMIPVGK